MTVKITLGQLPSAEDIAKLRAQKQVTGLNRAASSTVKQMFANPVEGKRVPTTYGELGADPSLATKSNNNIATQMFSTKLPTYGSTGLYGTDTAVGETRTKLENLLQTTQHDFAKLSNASNRIIREQALDLQRLLNNGTITPSDFQIKIQQLKTTSVGLGGFYQNILPHQKSTLDNNANALNNRFYTSSTSFSPSKKQDGTYEMSQVSDSMVNNAGFKGYENNILDRRFDISDTIQFDVNEPVSSAARVGIFGLTVAGYEEFFGERDSYKISSFNADSPMYLNAMILGIYQENTGEMYGPGSEMVLSNFGFGGENILTNIKTSIRSNLEQSLLGTTAYTTLSEKEQTEKLNSLTENVYGGLLKQAETLYAEESNAPLYATSMLEKHKMFIDNKNTLKQITYSSLATNYAIIEDIENFTNYFTDSIKTAFGGEIPTSFAGIISELDDMYVEGILGMDGLAFNTDELNIMVSKLAPINLHVLSVMAENAGLDSTKLFDNETGNLLKSNKEFFANARAAKLVDESGSVIGALADGLVGKNGVLSPEAIAQAKKIRDEVVKQNEARYGKTTENYRRDMNRYGVNTRKNKVAMDVQTQQNLYRGVLTGEMAVLNDQIIPQTAATQEKITKAIENFFKKTETAPTTEERPMGIDQEAPDEEGMLDILYNQETNEEINSAIQQYNIFETNKLKDFLYAFSEELAIDNGLTISEEQQNDFYNTFINQTRVG